MSPRLRKISFGESRCIWGRRGRDPVVVGLPGRDRGRSDRLRKRGWFWAETSSVRPSSGFEDTHGVKDGSHVPWDWGVRCRTKCHPRSTSDPRLPSILPSRVGQPGGLTRRQTCRDPRTPDVGSYGTHSCLEPPGLGAHRRLTTGWVPGERLPWGVRCATAAKTWSGVYRLPDGLVSSTPSTAVSRRATRVLTFCL